MTELWDDAQRLLAYGGQHRTLLRPLYRGEEGVFPRFAVRAEGCMIVDERGNELIDWAGAWGPVLLGYRHPVVEEAIRSQLEAGPTLSLMHPVEVEVARLLTETVPCAEMVAFGKNGSDVVTAAIRVARAATGREIVLQHGFHGFHDWYTCLFENTAGTPRVLRSLVEPFPYNDLGSLAALFEHFSGQVAAVVMEPVNIHLPEPGYLEAVGELAHAHGALLVFDEMVTGFRLANGGAQEHFGVQCDLACLGKALGNGMPITALVGPAEHMRHLPHVAYGMTFRGETLSLAAARATLEVIRDEPVAGRIARTGAHVREGFAALCGERGVTGRLVGPDARMTFQFEGPHGTGGERLLTLFLQECAVRGVLTHGTLLPSYAHDETAVKSTLETFAAALDAIANAGHDAPGRTLSARGFLDAMLERDGGLQVAGWLLVDDRCPDSVEFVAPGGDTLLAEPVERPGVARAHPSVPDAASSGYAAFLSRDAFQRNGAWEFDLRARRGETVVFECSVARRVRPDGGEPALQTPYDITGGSLYV
jgi:glutamate-1-semialdehyde aminotransferase